MAQRYDVIVVGAGILGASTAYHLVKHRNARVLLLDRAQAGGGSTGAAPGLVHQHHAEPLFVRLARDSIAMLAAMPAELEAGGGFAQAGFGMFVGADQLATARPILALQNRLGVDAALLAGLGIPVLTGAVERTGVAATIYERLGGYAEPSAIAQSYVAAFRRLDGTYKPGTPVRALTRGGDRVTGVVVDAGPLEADMVVNAAGPWAGKLAQSADLPLDLVVRRDHETVWLVRTEKAVPSCAIISAADGTYLRPQPGQRFVIGRIRSPLSQIVDPTNSPYGPNPAFTEEVRGPAEARFPSFAGMVFSGISARLCASASDGYPVVGPRSGLAGYADANGGGDHGVALAPAIGKELARWLHDGQAAEDFARLSHDRVTARRLFNVPEYLPTFRPT